MTSPSERLHVEVLGPLRVVAPDGGDITPAGDLPRRLLALLVLRRGRVVSLDSAIETLWPSKRPGDPVAALHNHVFRLRRWLPAGLVESVPDGYRLDPAGVDVDADQLAVALGGGTSNPVGLEEIETVLARWRGPAYAELDEVDEARTEAVRLEELRTRAREARAEARLATGDTDGLVSDLVALADEQPLRERPRELLMDALATADRHAEALRVFDDFRRLLGDELGIEPSPVLVARHQELLTGTAIPSWAPETRLPVPTSSLIGRDQLLAEMARAVETERLVSLVGPGGVGKTRLLVEVGHRLLNAWPDRSVVLCELARADGQSAVDVVAAASGIDGRLGIPLVERLADVLGDTEIVLLLDNCEHVLDPIAELVDHLLRNCRQLRAVATSRERLRVEGEQVCVVPPLPVEDLTTAPAIELFLERARTVATGFEPSEDELRRIEGIVSRLDGLPLAIELAAARMLTHDVEELAAGLDQRFELLSLGYRPSTRHGSLAAAMSWSYRLLDEDVQSTFANLSVFTGSFDAFAAAAVCGLDETTARSRLAQLVERSLVLREPGPRYVLLETLRVYGAERLTAEGRLEEVSERHARHMVDWVERADRLAEPGTPILAEIDAAVPELRRALGWLLDHDKVEDAGRLVVSLFDYGFLRLRPDVLVWAERVAAADPGDRSPCAAQVWAVGVYAAWMAGDVPEAGTRAARAFRVATEAGDAIPALVLAARGAYELFQGRLSESAAWYRHAAETAAVAKPAFRLMPAGTEILARGYAGDPEATVLAETLLADIGGEATPYAAYMWYCAGEADLTFDVDRARIRFERALQLAEATNAVFVTGVAGASKASIDARFGNPAEAVQDYRKLIHHWRRAGMWSTQWTMLRSIAALLDRLGHHYDAAVLAGAVWAIATSSGQRIFGADEVALSNLDKRLREALGKDTYQTARQHGGELDRDAAVEYALRAL